MLTQIRTVLDTKVRPFLQEHGGDVELISFGNGILRLRMVGQCASCPAASLTNESLISAEICAAIPSVEQVLLVQETSPSLLAEARALMTRSVKGA